MIKSENSCFDTKQPQLSRFKLCFKEKCHFETLCETEYGFLLIIYLSSFCFVHSALLLFLSKNDFVKKKNAW